ncbi:U2 small nuclear ribonucleoprotein B'' [Coemansia sp. RSA 1199]|nr:U2 small nuclear ribonucleoprotein B'' [Coemansia sp. RSA 1199]
MASIPPSQTIYIRNLNDKIQKDVLKHTLYGLCVAYGRVLDIVALKTLKMRGQAFVAFSDITSSTAALRQLNGRKIFGRPMQIEYALSKSNIVAQNDGTYRFNEPHKHMSGKQRKQLLGLTGDLAAVSCGEKRRQSEGADGRVAKRRVTEGEQDESSDEEIGPAVPQTEASEDEPSLTLFVTNLPENISADVLTGLFQQYAGFKHVRRIPGKNDMAFVDYESLESATAARGVLDGFKLSAEQAMKVAYSR